MIVARLSPAPREHGKPVDRSLVYASGNGRGPGSLSLIVGSDVDHYAVREIRTEFGGRAFELTKESRRPVETYYILILPESCECSCAGGIYVGHCKHLDAVLELIRRKEL